MTTATISWGLPTPGSSQAPIAGVTPEVSADGGTNWSSMPDVPATDPQQVVIADIASGDWLVRLTVNDVQGESSGGVVTPFAVPFNPPSDVVNVDIALS